MISISSMHIILKISLFVILTHCFSFLLEMLFQFYCRPITIQGFFNILRNDNEGSLCFKLRETSVILSKFQNNIIFQLIGICLLNAESIHKSLFTSLRET